jgi:hypothetical protein
MVENMTKPRLTKLESIPVDPSSNACYYQQA